MSISAEQEVRRMLVQSEKRDPGNFDMHVWTGEYFPAAHNL